MSYYKPRKSLFKPEIKKRGIYILPNLLTTGALFCGFYAIVQAMQHRYEQAAIAIFIAMVLDGLDGRVARLTRTQSAFGAEYDSLSDMVSFGVAPALVIYIWILHGIEPFRFGWIAAFVYCVGAALRLARFNTTLETVDKRYFQGLPSPAAAALIAGFIWVADSNQLNLPDLRWFAFGITLFAGVTMISNIKYYSFKYINLKKTISFTRLAALVLGFIPIVISIVIYPSGVLFGLFAIYALSGYVLALFLSPPIRKIFRKKPRPSTPTE